MERAERVHTLVEKVQDEGDDRLSLGPLEEAGRDEEDDDVEDCESLANGTLSRTDRLTQKAHEYPNRLSTL